MAVTKVSFADMAAFAAWAAETLVPDYFAAVEYSGNTLTGYRDAAKTQPLWAFESSENPTMTAYKSENDSRTVTGQALASAGYPQAAWVCGHGVMIDGTNRRLCAVLTKNNRDALLTVIGGDTAPGNGCFTGNTANGAVYCTVWGDDAGLSAKLQFVPRSANQTVLVPFCSDAQAGAVSYAPHAFYLPEGQYYGAGFGRFEAAGKTYLTNGYWALLDA